MNFTCAGLVHVLERMWDIDRIEYTYADGLMYLRKQCPMNIKFYCCERALWLGDIDGFNYVTPTQELATCLFCIALESRVHQET